MNRYNRSYSSSDGGGLAFILGIVTLIPLILWDGFVVKTIWNWFIPQTFDRAPHLTTAQGIGISLVVSVITTRRVASSSEPETALEAILSDILFTLIMSVIFLIIGAVVHQYV